MKDNIKTFRERMENLRDEQNKNHINLGSELTKTQEMNERLAKEATNLATALQNKKVQGNWGEMILERVLECSGLQEGIGYEKQPAYTTETGERQQPDFVFKLPGERKIIIDSKMSIENYKRWAVEPDETKKGNFLKQHVEDITRHIDSLSNKEYQKLLKENGLDFVIMFIPIEYAYFVALEKDNNLNEYASKKKVAIATASSIFPILQVVKGLWRIDRANKNTAEIIKAGEDMHKRVEAFLEKMTKLGAALDKSKDVYDNAMKRLEGGQGIIKSARKLENLGINVKYQESLNDKLEAGDGVTKTTGVIDVQKDCVLQGK